MAKFWTIVKKRIIVIIGFFLQILFYEMRNYSFFKKYNEIFKNRILPMAFMVDIFVSKMRFNSNLTQIVNIRLTYRPNNRAGGEISPLNLDAPRRETYGGNQPNYDNRISSNYNLYN